MLVGWESSVCGVCVWLQSHCERCLCNSVRLGGVGPWGPFLRGPHLSLLLLQESFSEHLGFTGGIVQG